MASSFGSSSSAATTSAAVTGPPSGQQGLTRRTSRSAAKMMFSMKMFYNEVVPFSLSSIAPILRVATKIETRVSYLCRFYAFRLDLSSTVRGVLQFKTFLLQLLERMVVIIVYIFLYGKLYLSLSGVELAFMYKSRNNSLKAAMASQSAVQLGLLMALPMVMYIKLDRGFIKALGIIIMQLQLCFVFLAFSLRTKSHYFVQAILHGGAKSSATGLGFNAQHVKFAENYRLYSRSHFTMGLELMLMLIVYHIYGSATTDSTTCMLLTASTWFLVSTWLFAPFLFNPSGFELKKIFDDWDDWSDWIDTLSAPANKSWESWLYLEHIHLWSTGILRRFWEIILLL